MLHGVNLQGRRGSHALSDFRDMFTMKVISDCGKTLPCTLLGEKDKDYQEKAFYYFPQSNKA